MGSKCRLCRKEFVTDMALLQHWRDKHPDEDPPELLSDEPSSIKSETRSRAGKRGGRRHGGGRKKLLAIATSILIVIIALSFYHGSQTSTNKPTIGVNVGDGAPDFHVTLLNGADVSLGYFRGHPVLLWFVTTWCSSCQQGAQMLASQYYAILHSKGVVILVVELYDNLGQPGPSLSQFANQFGGGATEPDWYYGTSSRGTTYTYDPKAYLDVYYLLDSQGKIITEGLGLPDGLRSIASHL